MENAISGRAWRACPMKSTKAWRDSQGSLPKTGPNTYLYENSTEL